MEFTQLDPSVKTPSQSRQIGWLGGAIFGRTRRENNTARERNDVDILTLALLAVVVEGTNAMLQVWGPRPCLAAMIVLAILNVLWIKLFYRNAKMIFRVESIALLFLASMNAYLFISSQI